MNYVRDLNQKSLSKKNYNMRIAPEEDSLRLTGYEKGGVTPLGMKTENIPVILHESVTKLEPPLLFLGAGHVDWKVAFPVKEFVKATGCFVADLD
jgi:prolyl-tRNA editing enzyme YbaK/EbsC (Cys-tRNA(Pro) deacylase)